MPKKTIQVGAGAVIVENGKILLAKRKGSHAEGTYGSFGGHVEFGETPIQAVQREAMEELGIELHDIRFATCTNLIKYGKHYIDISFVARLKSGKPKILEPHKVESIGWYSLKKLPEPLFEPVKLVLESIQQKKSYFEIYE